MTDRYLADCFDDGLGDYDPVVAPDEGGVVDDYDAAEFFSAKAQTDGIAIGTCQGCGSYGTPGSVCYRNGEECGERL